MTCLMQIRNVIPQPSYLCILQGLFCYCSRVHSINNNKSYLVHQNTTAAGPEVSTFKFLFELCT